MHIPPYLSFHTSSTEKLRQRLTTANFPSSIPTTEHLTTYIPTNYSSMINTTQKNPIYNRNKFLFSLILSLLFISLCIGFSYCIFIYLNHCINTISIVKHDYRISSTDSNSDKWKINKRRSSTDSIELFRY